MQIFLSIHWTSPAVHDFVGTDVFLPCIDQVTQGNHPRHTIEIDEATDSMT